MKGKPVLWREAKTVLKLKATPFQHKLLCDGITLNLGDLCAYSCEFCYVESQMRKLDKGILDAHNQRDGSSLGYQDVVIRRRNALKLLEAQLQKLPDPKTRHGAPDQRVVFASTLVDVAANMELLRETAAACNLILEHTQWQIRLLSKSSLLKKLIEDKMIPEKHHQRLIFGFSTGTLDDRLAAAIETGTTPVSKRLEALHWLQDRGLRTFGMICPSLPQDDYNKFSRAACEAIRVKRCEHVWAEVINPRDKSFERTVAALQAKGFTQEAAALEAVVGGKNSKRWETYARATFEAHAQHIPADKFRFLQYVKPKTLAWWQARQPQGAVVLGKAAENAEAADPARSVGLTALTKEDQRYRDEREGIVSQGVKASIAAAKALHEIRSYKDGLLWKATHSSFQDYCRAKWDYAKTHAYRLADCGALVAELQSHSPKGESLPRSEAQVRPLLALPREERVSAWQAVVAEVGPDELTGRAVAKKVRDFVRERNIPLPSPAPKPGKQGPLAVAALERLRAAIGDHRNVEKIRPLLDRVEALLQ